MEWIGWGINIFFAICLIILMAKSKKAYLRDKFKDLTGFELDLNNLVEEFEIVLVDIEHWTRKLNKGANQDEAQGELEKVHAELKVLREIESEFGFDGAEQLARDKIAVPEFPYDYSPNRRAAPKVKYKGPASAR